MSGTTSPRPRRRLRWLAAILALAVVGGVGGYLVYEEIENRRFREEPVPFPDLPLPAREPLRPAARPPATPPPPVPPGGPLVREPIDPASLPGLARLSPADVRGFTHVRHERLPCATCHRMDDARGGMGVRTRSDCMECHHVTQAAAVGCGPCHAAAELAGPRPMPVRMAVSAWTAPRARDLPFDHDAHASLACQDCHARAPGFVFDVGCVSCHESHHAGIADCRTCHVPAPDGVHGREVHLTCAGAGCHDALPVPAPAMREGRNVCLLCHRELVDHEPGRSCVGCHLLPPHRGP